MLIKNISYELLYKDFRGKLRYIDFIYAPNGKFNIKNYITNNQSNFTARAYTLSINRIIYIPMFS